jgi:hypothetical protein
MNTVKNKRPDTHPANRTGYKKPFHVKAALVTLAVMFAITWAGCGNSNPVKNEEESTTETGGKLNPPAWLIGKWTREIANPAEDIVVTAHNVTVSSGNLDFSFQIENEYLSNFKETLNGNLYTLSYISKIPAGEAISYNFEPYDNGKMKLTLTMTSFGVISFIYVKT